MREGSLMLGTASVEATFLPAVEEAAKPLCSPKTCVRVMDVAALTLQVEE